MNVNALFNSTDPHIQPLVSNALSGRISTNGAASTSIDPSSLSLPQDSNPQLSPFAQVLSTFQQLQQSDPAKYQQVTAQIATNLQSAAQTATADGSTALASQLNQLATDFKNASQNNTLPNVQDLAQAVNGSGVHHHHRHHHPASSSNLTSSNATDSTPNSSQSSTTSPNNVSSLISAFVANSTSATQNSALNPLSIIDNTLTNAGINLA